MVNKFTLCLPLLRGSKEEGEVGAPKHSTHPAQAVCIMQVHVMGVHRGVCRVCAAEDMCRRVFASTYVFGSGGCGQPFPETKLASAHGDHFTPSLEPGGQQLKAGPVE